MAVAFGGQVERGVCGIEVRVATMTGGETFHLDVSEDGRQRSAVAGLDGAVGDRVGVAQRADAFLGRSANGEVVLAHPSQQLAATAIKLVFQFGVSESGRVAACEPTQRFFEAHP